MFSITLLVIVITMRTAQVVIEIVNQSSIGYIDLEMTGGGNNYIFTPQFASGSLFTTTILDSLLCQVPTLSLTPSLLPHLAYHSHLVPTRLTTTRTLSKS